MGYGNRKPLSYYGNNRRHCSGLHHSKSKAEPHATPEAYRRVFDEIIQPRAAKRIAEEKANIQKLLDVKDEFNKRGLKLDEGMRDRFTSVVDNTTLFEHLGVKITDWDINAREVEVEFRNDGKRFWIPMS